MKKQKLKLKIALTNMSRVIMSVLFINLGTLSKSKATTIKDIQGMEPTCYAVGPSVNTGTVGDRIIDLCQSVFILLIPIVLIILLIIVIVKKIKEKGKNNNEKNDK